MTTQIIDGQTTWSGSRDKDGYTSYKIKFYVRGATTDGPANALNTDGLPAFGDIWDFDDDLDEWAFCTQEATVTPLQEKEPNSKFEIEFKFTSVPDDKKCKRDAVTDPLLIPQEVSGSFKNYHEEATYDRKGKPIAYSSHEIIRGPKVEFDKNRLQIKIKQNVPALQLPLLASMVDTVNDSLLWGCAPRCIKLSAAPWERKFHGVCYVYYTRTLEFDIRLDTFDRDLLDEGTKVLNGHWDKDTGEWVLDPVGHKFKADGTPTLDINGNEVDQQPDPNNPEHFIRFKDRRGDYAKVVLNGAGIPAGVMSGTKGKFISIEDTNLNNSVTDSTAWLPLNDGAIPPGSWSDTTTYTPGDMVFGTDGDIYVCLDADQGSDPADTPPHTDIWQNVTSSITDKGTYSTTTSYSIGDYVEGAGKQAAGSIHIEKYSESNFLLLGIPLDF